MRVAVTIGVALALAGCARHRVPRGGETITYRHEATAICLACPSYAITLGPDGQGIFVGGRNAAASGEHRFQATPEQARAFAASLRPYRPEGERLLTGLEACPRMSTDADTIDVRWQPALGQPAHLAFYVACDPQRYRAMEAALVAAPDLLPVTALIGAR